MQFDLLQGRKIPSRLIHSKRNKYQKQPSSNIVCSNTKNKRNLRIFKEIVSNDNGTQTEFEWHEQPWYLNIFHHPAVYIKLLCYDDHGGSSEFFVKKKDINVVNEETCDHYISPNLLKEGSYNFRDYDQTSHFKHFLADILPVAIYCKCVGA